MFKKISLTVIFTLALVFTIAGMASASDIYTYGSIGYQDPMLNLSGALRFGNFGMEIGLGFRQYPEILDYPCPHDDYIIIDDHYKSALLGMDLLHFVDIGENCSLYSGVGFYLVGYDMVAESNATGWLYREDTTFEGRFAYSGGLQIHEDHIGIGIGYHSLRGVNLQMVIKM